MQLAPSKNVATVLCTTMRAVPGAVVIWTILMRQVVGWWAKLGVMPLRSPPSRVRRCPTRLSYELCEKLQKLPSLALAVFLIKPHHMFVQPSWLIEVRPNDRRKKFSLVWIALLTCLVVNHVQNLEHESQTFPEKVFVAIHMARCQEEEIMQLLRILDGRDCLQGDGIMST
ncbi:uncharacterized protein B0I36DRAFT_338773 [Microdochium trichocladiopsis]|uniref:Uncharacterized protein n=1 Tax=Microdochium trichocladiopsis TaxID=1682393 RepID=A0A9P9BIK2_9PEZI|nr:uncharacterized protein B0I36DRAFT_338773 [Microdochium trichocladiopsis]KAH7014478.1 hypothetical protein B0I36DRAFT_338773 [Microdochium trichocladiopsis]